MPTAERLAPYFSVYVPDLPGYGTSDKPGEVLDVPGLADVLMRWMTDNHIAPVHLIANSFGCQVVVDLAVRYPDPVRSTVLIGPTTDPRARTPHQQIFGLLLDGPRERISLWPTLMRDSIDMGPRRALLTFRHMLADAPEEKLSRVLAPTLVVRGERDPIASKAWTEEVARLLPRGELLVVPGAPHAINYSAPDRLIRVVLPFLKRASTVPLAPP